MDRLAEDKRVYKKEEDETKSKYLYELGFTITLGVHLKIYIYIYIQCFFNIHWMERNTISQSNLAIM
jgi:hypothetical protein